MRTATGLHVTVWGEGEPAVFVHGSFGWGEETWAKQRPLADSYRLLLVDRRGFGGSPPDGSVDFDRDADDVANVLGDGAHLVGHSYGGVVSLLAAARHPDAVRSLTVIEPPALGLVREDPFVETFITGVDEAMRAADDPSDYRSRFLQNFGFAGQPQELEGAGLEAARSSWGERNPAEAQIPLEELRGVRTLVVRGDWSKAPSRAQERGQTIFHAICDVLERELDAESASFPGAHNPQLIGAPLNERLRTFWGGNVTEDVRDLIRRDLSAGEHDEIRELWKRHSIAEDERDLPGLISTLTPDCVYELVQTGHRWEGHEGAARFYMGLLTAFPDIHFDLTDIVIGPQGVCEEADVTGTHQAEWLGIPPSGERLAWKVVIFFPWDPAQRLFRGEKVYTAGLPLTELS